ncbi:MAG: trypsin-like peptidase domain-containing protein [Desulfobacterales bacterium]|nr:MAG: trypsin-like peptidase domain-containing protein [Desulfobacterales bacterium]
MKVRLVLLATIVILSFLTSEGKAQQDWTEKIAAFKPMVVNIETSSEIVFETERQGTSYGTGFIIDSARGIIATNAHVTGLSPSNVKINFYDGSFTQAKRLYFDPVHDFGFYQIDPDKVEFQLQAVQCGSWNDLAMGDELLFIGNNEREEYSVKFGTVANININKGDRHSSYIHTTFNSAGGSSGSPVWNAEGKVIGIHSRGSRTSDFELPIDYLLDALYKIQNNIPIKRGEIGVDLQLITMGEAIQHFGLSKDVAAEIKPLCKGTPKVIQIESLIPRSSGEGLLQQGDIVYKLNGALLGDNLYLFDALLDANVEKKVRLEVFRSGKPLGIEVYVEDIEKQKICRFVRFAGAIFHDITPQLRRVYDFAGDGVNMSCATDGSSLAHLGYRDKKNRFFRVIVSEFNGKPLKNLDDFIEACAEIEDGQNTFAIVRDFMEFNTSLKPKSLTINLKYGPLELFAWNAQVLEWQKVAGDTDLKTTAASAPAAHRSSQL